MIEKLKEFGIEFKQNVDLKNFCTMRCSANAKLIVFPKNIAQTRKVVRLCHLFDQKFFVLGEGSNLVFLDNDFVFIKLDTLNKVKIRENCLICGSGAKLAEICTKAKDFGLSGLEGLFGIPASVGGACVMNARAFGYEIGSRVDFVKCITSEGKIVTYSKDQCNFAYKQSIFQNSNLVIVQVGLRLKMGDPKLIWKRMQNFLDKRMKTQPVGFSAGCVFKNCHCTVAGKAIDNAGFGGFRFKNFEVSKKHCNFILNNGKGKGKDLKILIEKIKRKVYNNCKIRLEEEVIFVGER